MKIHPSVSPLILFAFGFGFAACSQAPTRPSVGSKSNVGSGNGTGENGSKGNETEVGQAKDPSKSLIFELGAVSSDAVDYTFGAMELRPKTFADESFKLTRYYRSSDPEKLSDTQKTALASICRDIALSRETGKSGLNLESAAPQIVWRSHYRYDHKLALNELLAAGQKNIQCIVKIEAEGKDEIAPFYLVLDPLPADEKNLRGSTKIADAMDEGITLPLVTESLKLDLNKIVAITQTEDLKLGIKALQKDKLALTPETSQAAPVCYVDSTKQTQLVNGAKELSNRYTMKDEGVELGTLLSRPVDGRLLKNCAAVKAEIMDGALETKLSCDQYQAIRLEGIEAGCQWDLEVFNSADKGESVAVRVSLEKAQLKLVNLSSVDGSLEVLPQASKNPVRDKTVNFQNFSQKGLKSLEQMFDLWVAVEPASFEKDFAAVIKTVVLEQCESGVVGYAKFGSTFWFCYLAAFTESALDRGDYPERPILQLITAAHEVRHASKWLHDKDVASYQPCEGTAASNATLHSIVSVCQEPYCVVLRKAAVREYIQEIDYSLARDARKFKGICQTWNNDLGVTNQLTR